MKIKVEISEDEEAKIIWNFCRYLARRKFADTDEKHIECLDEYRGYIKQYFTRPF